MPPRSREEFEIAVICALPLEADAVEALFDEHYDGSYGKQVGDDNTYKTGKINGHHVVLALMPGTGNRSSASVARSLRVSYTRIKLALVVGICGGSPYSTDNAEIVLGDVIISDSIVEYDFGRQYPNGFVRKSGIKETFGQPNQEIRSFLNNLRTRRTRAQVQQQVAHHLKELERRHDRDWSYPGVGQDILLAASRRHKHYEQITGLNCICVKCHSSQESVCDLALKSDCRQLGCGRQSIQRRRLEIDGPETHIHIGTIASANTVMRSAEHRDQLAKNESIIGFEMEGAGVWDSLPCVIIKGVCDYADSHKDKVWQNYAAATAASCAKASLMHWTSPVQDLQASCHPRPSATTPCNKERLSISWKDIMTAYLSESTSPGQLEVAQDIERLRTTSEDLQVFLQVLQILQVSFPNPNDYFDPASVPKPVTEMLRNYYTRFSYISSLCLTIFFKELLRLFGVHFILFFYILKQCSSQVPKLLVGADIIFEDVLGEQIRLPYRKYRSWGHFTQFLRVRFFRRHGEQYVTSGQFQLYDYKGSSLTREAWSKISPNSKVTMSVIVRLSERNVCGRCFKLEDAQGTGIIKCSNCGLKYSMTRPANNRSNPFMSEETTESELEAKDSGQPVETGLSKTVSPENNTERYIDSTLGYNQELEHFSRVDFEVTLSSKSLCFVITQLGGLFDSLFKLVMEYGHLGTTSSEDLAGILRSLRSCRTEIRLLMNSNSFAVLENDEFMFSGNVDYELFVQIRRQWIQVRYEFTTAYRQMHSEIV